MGLGNLSDAIRLEFKCLLRAEEVLRMFIRCVMCVACLKHSQRCGREMSQGNAMPRAIAADIAEGQEATDLRKLVGYARLEDAISKQDDGNLVCRCAGARLAAHLQHLVQRG